MLLNGEKLMAAAMCTAHVIDTRQQFPAVSPRWRKQFPGEGGSGSILPGVEELPQELLFSAIESKGLGEDFIGSGGGSDDDLPEEGERLAMIALPTLSETWDSVVDIVALQSYIPAWSFLFCFYLLSTFLIGLFDAEILFTDTPLSVTPPSYEVEELEIPQVRPMTVKRKKLVSNSSCSCIRLVFTIPFMPIIR